MRTEEETIKFRISPEEKALIQHAAELEGVTLSEYLRAPAVERAKSIIAEVEFRKVTSLLPTSFSELLDALDNPGDPVPALVRAASRLATLGDLADLK